MRVSNCWWGLCATVLAASASHSDDIDRSFSRLDDSPRFMLYVHKTLGAPRRRNLGPTFGFAVDRSMPVWSGGDTPALLAPTARVFDLRIAPFAGNEIFLNGFQLTGHSLRGLGYDGSYDDGGSFDGDSFDDGESWSRPWVWVAAGLAGAAGVSCLTRNWPCERSSSGGREGYRVPSE